MAIPIEIENVALLGWHVYPQSQYSKAACFKDATSLATCDLDTIASWCKRFPGCNWRVVFGPSKLWGLDIDVPPGHAHDGRAGLQRLLIVHGALPPHPITLSGGGGNAVFFRDDGHPIIGHSNVPAPGIDPRRGRHSVTIPPSVHLVTKRPYEWIRPPWEVSPPAAPKWLLKACTPPPAPEPRPAPVLHAGDKARNYAIAALRNEVIAVAAAAPSTANNTLNVAAFKLARFIDDGLLSTGEIRDSLLAGARARHIPTREAILTIDSGLKGRHS